MDYVGIGLWRFFDRRAADGTDVGDDAIAEAAIVEAPVVERTPIQIHVFRRGQEADDARATVNGS